MTVQGRSHVWAWEGIGPPTWEPEPHMGSQAQPIRIRFSPQKGFITDRNASQFHQLSGWLVSDDPAGEEAGCGGPGLSWLHVRPVGRTAKFSKTTLEVAYCREINIKLSGNSSGRHSCSQHANAPSKLETYVALCCVTKLHILNQIKSNVFI